MRSKSTTALIWDDPDGSWAGHNVNYVFTEGQFGGGQAAKRGADMAEKDIRKLRRPELIEIIYQLKKSEQELQAQVEALQSQLLDKNLKMEKAGSIAEAAVLLSEVFTSAQTAADTYVAEVKRRHAEAEAECRKMIFDAKKEAEAIVQEAHRQKDSVEQQCERSRAELRKVQAVLRELTGDLPDAQ